MGYQDCSLVPVATQIHWERAQFIDGAAKIVEHLGYEAWKHEEIARTLENIFRGTINAGKTFDEARFDVEAAIQRAITGQDA